jgi:hypothetical protein
LKVIDVQRGITVARLEMELTDEERPTLEFEGIMVGDHIDLGSITTEQPKKPKAKAKKHVATVATTAVTDQPAPGSAEAMAERHASVQPAPASVPAPATTDTSKPVEMKTAVDVKTDTEASPAPSEAATNNSNAPRAPVESAPKKSQAPKSAELEDGTGERNSYPVKRSADTVRVADYTDAG